MAKTENLLHRLDELQRETGIPRTIFAACPNSPSVSGNISRVVEGVILYN